MSAGFSLGDKVFWGSNGAVEACVEVMAAKATDRLGSDDPLAVFLRDEREQFYMGKIVFLDDWVAAKSRRRQLLELLDMATDQLLSSGVFTEYGKEWAKSTMADLRACIAGMDTFRDGSEAEPDRLRAADA